MEKEGDTIPIPVSGTSQDSKGGKTVLDDLATHSVSLFMDQKKSQSTSHPYHAGWVDFQHSIRLADFKRLE